MYDVEKCSAVLENVIGFARLDAYVYNLVTNGSIGVCLYIEETNFPFSERRTSRNATSAEFLEVQIPPRVLVYDWDPLVSCVKR